MKANRIIGIACFLLSGVAIIGGIIALCVILGGCIERKPAPVPAPPQRTQQNIDAAQKVAGAITDKARAADERGLIPRSTDSGTLVKLAVANESYVGSPAVRVDAENGKALDALVNAMQRQEEAYRAERAGWEAKIDAISRDRDRAVIEASGFGAQIGRLKAWLFWGAVLLVVACILSPGILWAVARFAAGRVRAHLAQVVDGVERFTEAAPERAGALKAELSRAMDRPAKDLVAQLRRRVR
jgi:hypothetical protein